jgi:group I intron endonuclease
MSKPGIYKIMNSTTGEFYIGSSVNTTRRMGVHKSQLRGNYHNNQHLQRSWNKYGETSFEFSVVELCSSSADELINREQHYIDTFHPTFNILSVAYSFSGYHHTEDARRRIGNAHKGNKYALGNRDTDERKLERIKMLRGRKQTDGAKKKISEFQKSRVHTEEEKRKISKTRTGYKLSDTTKKKLSDINKAKTLSPETREKIRLSLLGKKNALGNKLSDETKKRMSEARLAYFERKRNEVTPTSLEER